MANNPHELETTYQIPDQLGHQEADAHHESYGRTMLSNTVDFVKNHFPGAREAAGLGATALVAAAFSGEAVAQQPEANAAGVKTPYGLYFANQRAEKAKENMDTFDRKSTAGQISVNPLLYGKPVTVTKDKRMGRITASYVTIDGLKHMKFAIKAPLSVKFYGARSQNVDLSIYAISKAQMNNVKKTKHSWSATWTDPAPYGQKDTNVPEAYTSNFVVGYQTVKKK